MDKNFILSFIELFSLESPRHFVCSSSFRFIWPRRQQFVDLIFLLTIKLMKLIIYHNYTLITLQGSPRYIRPWFSE